MRYLGRLIESDPLEKLVLPTGFGHALYADQLAFRPLVAAASKIGHNHRKRPDERHGRHEEENHEAGEQDLPHVSRVRHR